MLITIEGIDGAGKSTLIRTLRKSPELQGIEFTREPGSGWIGEQVRRGIREEIDPLAEALLFAADHAQHLEGVIRPALAAGKVVISDRYTDSRYAYQSVSLEGHVADPLRWLRSVHQGWSMPPDRTILLIIPVDEAVRRIQDKEEKEHFEQRGILEKVQKNYLSLAEEEPERFLLIDALLTPEIIAEMVIREITGSLTE